MIIVKVLKSSTLLFYLILFLILSACSDSIQTEELNQSDHVAEIQAETLVSEFEKNMVQAENKYRGKYIIIEGKLSDINRDIDGNTYINLYSIGYKRIIIYFNKREEDQTIGNLKLGQRIKVKTQMVGEKLDHIVGREGKIIIPKNEEGNSSIHTTNTVENKDKNDRKAILNAIRVPVQKELRQEVKFVVYRLNICNNYAILLAKPVKMNGGPVDYVKTEYQEQINNGAFDDGVQAILHLENNVWIVKNYVIGATDSPVQMWVEQFDLSSCKDEFGIQ